MELPDRGEKHRCFQCHTLFYDLKRPKLVCPRCGVDQADEAKLKPAPAKKSRKAAPKLVVAAPPPEEAPEAEEPEEPEAAEEADDEDDDEPEDLDD